ncbi:MAG: VanW family protein [Armatimonadota bacterium]
MGKGLLCNRHPLLYLLSVTEKRACRFLRWYFGGRRYCRRKSIERLPFRIKAHESPLIRKLGNSDVRLQQNKITNLSIAMRHIDGIVIAPGETFSFFRLVGMATKAKGYKEGMVLRRGEARPGIGGGLCQLSNLIHWMVLHSPLTVVERHHHSFDPFPDEGRVLPFGSGATLFYNYKDYQFANNTPYTFQVCIGMTDTHLKGELRCSEEVPYTYHVYERNHEFLKIDSKCYRRNEILRDVIDKRTGKTVSAELVTSNFAEVKYALDPGSYTEVC